MPAARAASIIAWASPTSSIVKRQQPNPSGPTSNTPIERLSVDTKDAPVVIHAGYKPAVVTGVYRLHTGVMEFEISDSAMEAIRAKGGTAAIDFIDPIG